MVSRTLGVGPRDVSEVFGEERMEGGNPRTEPRRPPTSTLKFKPVLRRMGGPCTTLVDLESLGLCFGGQSPRPTDRCHTVGPTGGTEREGRGETPYRGHLTDHRAPRLPLHERRPTPTSSYLVDRTVETHPFSLHWGRSIRGCPTVAVRLTTSETGEGGWGVQ